MEPLVPGQSGLKPTTSCTLNIVLRVFQAIMSNETAGRIISFEEIKLWEIETLKSFLRAKGFKIPGRMEELVALVFACHHRPDLPKAVRCNKDLWSHF